MKELNGIEQRLIGIYKEFKGIMPGLHKLTFEISEYTYRSEPKLHGWYHINDDCKNYNSISELIRLEILFRKF